MEEINRNWNSQNRETHFYSDVRKELKLRLVTELKEIESKLNEFEKEKLSVERLIYNPNQTQIDELLLV